ncbi:MAG: tRNA threonylcarbamoyladenosine dehydratase [Clostridia bacterium]|nr:tRNA threonylcarbamoyladenosine dehydratase [Clostridia bacterium]
MEELFERSKLILGDKIDKLKSAKVLVCGLGGVGGYVLEALVRAGVGTLGLLDADVFAASNLNRQILATSDTIGKKKTDVAKERALSINSDCKVEVFDLFYLPETADKVDLSRYDYVVDAIDTVTAKLELITRAKRAGVNIISCMGTGNKLGTHFEVADVYKTSVCPLAKVMRKELKARGIDHLKVVYSKEEPIIPADTPTEAGRHIPGSISYSPAIAGLVLAAEVIKDLTK